MTVVMVLGSNHYDLSIGRKRMGDEVFMNCCNKINTVIFLRAYTVVRVKYI
jgi:hypothetical protein